MANKVKLLPCELIEEILSRVPPKSLVRFRTVCKQWNALFDDKTFINNHKAKATFRFILTDKSKIYSVSINPEIEVHELTLDVPGLEFGMLESLVDRNELLICRMKNGSVIWNPCLKQSTWIESDCMRFVGIGYDNRSYKILGSCRRNENPTKRMWKIYNFASHAWKDYESRSSDTTEGQKRVEVPLLLSRSVSLNGNLYWIASFHKTGDDSLFIIQFVFSSDEFSICCDLPCGTSHPRDALVLGVLKGDRFSLLKQCHATKKIEIWVTKNKITNSWDGEMEEWLKFMEVSIPNLPDLVPRSYSQPSYFIEGKSLVLCFCESGGAWIYVFGENKLIRKIQIDPVHAPWQYTYIPSLVQVPSFKREEVELQV